MLVEVGALITWCIYSYRIVMLLVPYMWASMTFLPKSQSLQEVEPSLACREKHTRERVQKSAAARRQWRASFSNYKFSN